MLYRDEMAIIFALHNRMDDYPELTDAIVALGPDAKAEDVIFEAGNRMLGRGTTADLVQKLQRRSGYISAALSMPFAMQTVPGTRDIERQHLDGATVALVMQDKRFESIATLRRLKLNYTQLLARITAYTA